MIAFVVGYLLNAAWRTPLAALGAVLLCRLARLSPGRRCLVFAGFLTLSVGLPALHGPAHLLATVAASASNGRPGLHTGAIRAAAVDAQVPLGRGTGGLIVGGWLVVFCIAGLRLALSVRRTKMLVRRSSPYSPAPAVVNQLRAFTRRHGMDAPAIRQSPDVVGPAVVGAWPAVILVPLGFETLEQDQVAAALLHECAHVVRRDYALNLACEMVALPLIWHPAVHWLKSGLRTAREIACDGMAAAEFGSRARYARRLVDLARILEDRAAVRPATALALLQPGGLEARVRDLLGPAPRGSGAAALGFVVAAVTALIILPVAVLHLTPSLGETAERSVVVYRQVRPRGVAQAGPLTLAARLQAERAIAEPPSITGGGHAGGRLTAERRSLVHDGRSAPRSAPGRGAVERLAAGRPRPASPELPLPSAPAVSWSEARLDASGSPLMLILHLDLLGSPDPCAPAATEPGQTFNPGALQLDVAAAGAGETAAPPPDGGAPAVQADRAQACMKLARTPDPRARTGAV